MSVRYLAVVTLLLLVSCTMLTQAGPVALLPTYGITRQGHDSEENIGEPTDREARENLLPDPILIKAFKFQPEMVESSSESSSSSALVTPSLPTEIDISLSKCTKVPRIKRISLPNCSDVSVDVGLCSGACNTRQKPQDSYDIVNGVVRFPVTRTCKCCQTKATEVRELQARCAYFDDAEASHLTTIRVEVVTKCHCRKCVAA